jgi:hypothetical protein
VVFLKKKPENPLKLGLEKIIQNSIENPEWESLEFCLDTQQIRQEKEVKPPDSVVQIRRKASLAFALENNQGSGEVSPQPVFSLQRRKTLRFLPRGKCI